MPIRVKVDISELKAKMQKAQIATGKAMDKIVKNTAINYAQSAASESKPEPGHSFKRLSKKAKIRPIVDMPEGAGVRKWWFMPDKKAVFTSLKDIPKKLAKAKGYVKITKAVLFWNKKKKAWDYFGYVKGFTAKWRLNVPRYGLGKWGWNGVAGALGKGLKNDCGSATVKKSLVDVKIEIHNKVRYASKVSDAGVLGRAQQAAMKMLDKVYLKKEVKRATT